jgi:hypothetical protein
MLGPAVASLMQVFCRHVKWGMLGKHRQASLTRVLSLGSGRRSVARAGRRLAGHLAWRVNARSSPRPR